MKESNQKDALHASRQASSQKHEPEALNAAFHSTDFTISTLPIKYHPHIVEIIEATKRLSKALHIQVGKATHEAHTSMTAFLYPDTGKYRLCIANVLYDFLYYIDDVFGEDIDVDGTEERPCLMTMMNIWTTGKLSATFLESIDNPKIKNIYNALHWVRTKLFETTNNPAFFKKLSKLLFEHLKDQIQPKDFETVEEYIMLRRRFGGMYPVIFLVEYASGQYLSEGTLEQLPSLQRAIDACADIGALSNDVFSYPKESHSKFNLVNSYLIEHPEMSLEEAVRHSIDLVNDCHFIFDTSIEQLQSEMAHLPEQEQATIRTFVEGMNDILSASYHWQFVTERFRHENHILEDLKGNSNYKFKTTTKTLITDVKKLA